ncbi:hypothetical protein NXC24_PB00216 (plasmid) [Rhizobium sp. NXC24]|nr:hypothetical protein NXC24_PB00216 [Rhizobium sp. NXC24]
MCRAKEKNIEEPSDLLLAICACPTSLNVQHKKGQSPENLRAPAKASLRHFHARCRQRSWEKVYSRRTGERP